MATNTRRATDSPSKNGTNPRKRLVTSSVSNPAAELGTAAKKATVQAAPWIEPLARFGYAAKGVVYAVIGVLAMQLALGSGGQATGPEGALGAIGGQPYGRFMLSVVAIGLLAYALWRFVQAAADPERLGKSGKAIAQRLGFAVSGFTYGSLGVLAALMALGRSSGRNGDQGPQDMTAKLMAQPFGVWIVGIVGLIVIGIALFQLYYAYTARFRTELKLHEMSRTETIWAIRSGRLGYAARGVIYAILGGFLINAAVHTDPGKAGGIGKALAELAAQPYGPWLLGAVALGLIAYAVYAFVQAKYRRILAR